MSKDSDIQSVMGFSGFGECACVCLCVDEQFSTPGGGKKTAMKFDIEKMFEETRRAAREYSEQKTAKQLLINEVAAASSEGVNSVTGVSDVRGEESSDEDSIGPPLPPGPSDQVGHFTFSVSL